MNNKKKTVQNLRAYSQFLYKGSEQLLNATYGAIHSMRNLPGFTDKGTELREALEDEITVALDILKGLDRRKPEAARAMEDVLERFTADCSDLVDEAKDTPQVVNWTANTAWELSQQLGSGFFTIANCMISARKQAQKKSGEKHE